MPHESLDLLERLRREGRRASMATVVRTVGTTPRKEGAKMFVGDDGSIFGSVTIGGCIDARVIEEAAASDVPHVVPFQLGDEDAWEIGLTCGGGVDVFVERLSEATFGVYETARRELEAGRSVAIVTTLKGPHAGERRIVDAAAVEKSDDVYVEILRPPVTLYIFGAGEVAIPMVSFAKTLGFRTVVIDNRPRFASRERFAEADEIRVGIVSEIAGELRYGPTTPIVLVAHDYKVEGPVLQRVLETDVPYIGLLGSRRRGPAILQLLREDGVAEERLARVRVPIGLDLGGQSAAEIALSIVAEVVAVMHGPEEAMVVFASKKVKRPVKWTESRTENFRATIHGRDHIQDVELAAKRDGTILGLRATVWANMGAYLSTASTGIPTILHGLMLSGAYKIPSIREDVYGVFTNTTPVDAYRGAGRPEATFIVERLVDLLAQELKMDPVEVRRKNLIPPFSDGYTVATGLVYDTGNYEGALQKALEIAGYDDLRKQQADLRARGEYLGIGLCTYAEICGLGPSQVAGAVGFGGGLWESAIVRFHPSGKVNVMVGISPHGQGEETTFAQIVASELGVDVDDVEIVHGDTDQCPMGWGTYGSRSTPVGSGALMGAIGKIKEKAKLVTAHLLEASADDIDYADGKFFVKGSPDKFKTIQDVALMANVAWNMPKGVEPGLEASSFFDPPNFVYPFGAHIAVVKVDAETGEVALQRYIAVDDCGKVINPMIVEGQIHGGIAQGAGQALWEGAVYDDNGQLLTGSMMDYAVPKAEYFPKFELAMTETPTTVNPLGVKGIGETGTIASTPAIYNAVTDALAPLGVKKINMPLTPERVWRAIREARS